MFPEANLKPFFDRLATVNPFLENRVNGPAPAGVDVADIHLKAFARLIGFASQALAHRRGLGAVLWGEAGVGKSHLLARLAAWAGEDNAVLVYLHNLQAAPEALPRALLYAVVGELTHGRRGGFAQTPLYELARAGVVEAAGRLGRFSWSQLENAHQHWLDRLGPAGGDRLVHEVLFGFFRSANRAARGREDGSVAGLAVRWLSGGALEPAEARLLGLPPGPRRDDPAALADAQQIKQVLIALSRLTVSHGRPFVLALDQVDNLDQEQFAALARFLEAVLDSAHGLLAVTCGIQATLLRWRDEGVVQQSAWDRIGQFPERLDKLTPVQAEQLVRCRLGAFLDSFDWAEPVAQARRDDGLFPLGRAWADRHLSTRIEIRPRDVLSLAREGWRQEQGEMARLGGVGWLAGWPHDGNSDEPGPSLTAEQVRTRVNEAVARQLAAIRDRLHAEPAAAPLDGDRLASLLHDLISWGHDVAGALPLVELRRVPPPRTGASPIYHLQLRQSGEAGEAVTGVLVLTASNATSTAGFLRRLADNPEPLDRLVLLTDQRVGLPLGGKGREYLDVLQGRQTPELERMELTFPEVAGLEALHGVVGRARSGDLEIDVRPGQPRAVTPEEVRASPAWREAFLVQRPLRRLLGLGAALAGRL